MGTLTRWPQELQVLRVPENWPVNAFRGGRWQVGPRPAALGWGGERASWVPWELWGVRHCQPFLSSCPSMTFPQPRGPPPGPHARPALGLPCGGHTQGAVLRACSLLLWHSPQEPGEVQERPLLGTGPPSHATLVSRGQFHSPPLCLSSLLGKRPQWPLGAPALAVPILGTSVSPCVRKGLDSVLWSVCSRPRV